MTEAVREVNDGLTRRGSGPALGEALDDGEREGLTEIDTEMEVLLLGLSDTDSLPLGD